MKTTVIFFSEFHWHVLGFLGKILIFLGFLGKINCQDLGKKSKKSKILATSEKNPRFWQEIQDYPRSWQENQDAKHWEEMRLLLGCITAHPDTYYFMPNRAGRNFQPGEDIENSQEFFGRNKLESMITSYVQLFTYLRLECGCVCVCGGGGEKVVDCGFTNDRISGWLNGSWKINKIFNIFSSFFLFLVHVFVWSKNTEKK